MGDLHPTRVLEEDLPYQYAFVNDSLFLGIYPGVLVNGGKFVTVINHSTGQELGRFCNQGRGPQDFLSPISADYRDGHLYIYDYMLRRYSDLDVIKSLSQGTEEYSLILPIVYEDGAARALLSIYKIEDRLLAFDTFQKAGSPDLSDTPDYSFFSLDDGRRLGSLNLFKDVPLVADRKEQKLVPVKERLSMADTYSSHLDKLCTVMTYIPQLNIIDVQSGVATGIKIADYAPKALKSGYRHYQAVSSDDERIYALYWGADEEKIYDGMVTNTELHIFGWDGKMLSRYRIPGLYIRCWVTESGLYMTKYVDDSAELYCIAKKELL